MHDPELVGEPAVEDSGRLDGASRWRIFSVLAIIVLYTEVAPIQYTMVAAGLQKISKTFSGVGGNINWAVIILGIVGAAAIPLLGKCSDIWGKKRIFLLCGVVFLVGCVIIAFVVLAVTACAFALTPYGWQAYLGIYLLGGIGSGFLYAAQPILIVEAVPAEQQGISAGMLGVMSSMGSGVIIGVTTALLNSNPVEAHIDVADHSSVTVLSQMFTNRGYAEGFWVVAGTTLIALGIALFMRHGRKPATGGDAETS